jgi:hypothetical protein
MNMVIIPVTLMIGGPPWVEGTAGLERVAPQFLFEETQFVTKIIKYEYSIPVEEYIYFLK